MKPLKLISSILMMVSGLICSFVCASFSVSLQPLMLKFILINSNSSITIILLFTLGITLCVLGFISIFFRTKNKLFLMFTIINIILLIVATVASFFLSFSTSLNQILQTILLVSVGIPAFIFSILSVTNLNANVSIADSAGNYQHLYEESISNNAPDLKRKIRELQSNLVKPSGEIIKEIEQTGQFSDIDFSELLAETKKETINNNARIAESFYDVDKKNDDKIKQSSQESKDDDDSLDDFTYIKSRNHSEEQIH